MENRFNTITETRPSKIGAFFRGALSGAGTGTLMSVIVTGVLAIGGAAFFATLASTAAVMIPATALFSGAMAVKQAMFDSPNMNGAHREQTVIPVPVAGITTPVISQSQAAAHDTPDHTPTKNWVASTSREGDSQSRVQQILDKGMSAQDRATAILAARDAASAEPSQRLM